MNNEAVQAAMAQNSNEVRYKSSVLKVLRVDEFGKDREDVVAFCSADLTFRDFSVVVFDLERARTIRALLDQAIGDDPVVVNQ